MKYSNDELIRDLQLDKLDDPEGRAQAVSQLLDFINDTNYSGSNPDWDDVVELAREYQVPNFNEFVRRDDAMEAEAMGVIDTVIGNFGLEALNVEGVWSSYWGAAIAFYSNNGDTYATTVVYDVDSGTAQLGSWGDFLEGWESEQEREDEDEDEDEDGFVIRGLGGRELGKTFWADDEETEALLEQINRGWAQQGGIADWVELEDGTVVVAVPDFDASLEDFDPAAMGNEGMTEVARSLADGDAFGVIQYDRAGEQLDSLWGMVGYGGAEQAIRGYFEQMGWTWGDDESKGAEPAGPNGGFVIR